MTLTFDVNFWSLVGVLLALYSVIYARARASADELEKIKAGLHTEKARQDVQEEKNRQALTEQRLNEIITPRLSRLESDLNGYGGRLDRMDERMKQTLTLQQLNHELKGIYDLIRDLDKGLGVVETSIGKLEGGFGKTAATVELIHSWLIEQKK